MFRKLQKSGVSYWSSRLIKRIAKIVYRGVAHEFLDLKEENTEKLLGASYVDHANGVNRVDKYERDERLMRSNLLPGTSEDETLPPRDIHFIYISNEAASYDLTLVSFIALKSAADVNPGWKIYLHTNVTPTGPLYQKISRRIEIVRCSVPAEVFGIPIDRIEHKSDVIRLQILLERGGVYLDLDTICLHSFDPLRKPVVVLGREGDDRLCNAVIVAPPGDKFISKWLECYRGFHNEQWNKFSVLTPARLAKEYPDLIHIEDESAFFTPNFEPEGLLDLFERTKEYPNAFVFHLWNKLAKRYVDRISLRDIQTRDCTYNRAARVVVAELIDKTMPMARKTLCLNMIVKNEMANLERCLASVAPHISCWVICDTGSTDGTQEFIKNFFKERRIPGQLHEFPFVNFQDTRNRALEQALTSSLEYDYILLTDADMELQVDGPHAFDNLWAEVYKVLQKSGVSYWNSRLIKRSAKIEYRGVTHEFLDLKEGNTENLSGAWYVDHASGANRLDKYERDEKLIRSALVSEADPGMKSRYTFYLANTLRDSGRHEAAILEYQKRAELGGWKEEQFVSLYNAAKLMEKLKYSDADVIGAYTKASDLLPSRAEALHGAARFCRVKGLHKQGYELATKGLRIPRPLNGLFVHDWIYDTGLLDEYAVTAYWAGHYFESLDACLKLLQSGKLNTAQMTRIAGNAARARDKLGAAAKPANLGRFSGYSYVANHRLDPPPPPRNLAAPAPRVLLAILAKQKEKSLPLYLKCIEELDYPKSAIVLYIRTNNNTDNTDAILRDWVARVGSQYAAVEFDAVDVEQRVQDFGVHEWNATRFKVLGNVRNISLQKTAEHDCAFYFVCDVDNFIRPCTLWELVNLNLPIVAPLLRSITPNVTYSNYHAEVDANGYYVRIDQYFWVLNRWVCGVMEMPVVHSTYAVRRDVIDQLTYIDDTTRHEYVVFSHSARKAGITQYFDNRHIYGYVAFDEGVSSHVEGGFDIARELMEGDGATADPS